MGVSAERLGGRGIQTYAAWGFGSGSRSPSGGGGRPGRRAPTRGPLHIGLWFESGRAVGRGVSVPSLSSVTSSLNPAWQSLTHRRDAQGRQGDLEVQLLP